MLVNSSTTVSNIVWRFFERTGAHLVKFIVSVILARILLPQDYGIVALISVFINILDVFVDSGLGSALIQKKDSDDIDFSTVFFANIVFCILLYGLFFITAPVIAAFYKNPQLILLTRVLGITIIISGVKNIQGAYIAKNMQFKKFFYATILGTLLAAVVGIYMACNGFGVWALVAQQLTNLLIDTFMLWITVKWRPKFIFSFERLGYLFSYGWKLLVSSLLDTIFIELRHLIIGRKYTPEDLAFYNKGSVAPKTIIININNSIDSVLFPSMSMEQKNMENIKRIMRRTIKTSTYCIAPLMIGLAVCAESVIRLLYSDKWIFCVPYMRIFCITYIFWPIHTANLNAIKAVGRSDLFLKLEILKKIVGLVVLLTTMWYGVMIMAYSLLLTSVLTQIINSWPNKKILNYGYLEQLKDISSGLLLSLFMGVIVYLVNFLNVSPWIKLLIQVPLGASIFIFGSILFKLETYDYLRKMLIEKFFNKKK